MQAVIGTNELCESNVNIWTDLLVSERAHERLAATRVIGGQMKSGGRVE